MEAIRRYLTLAPCAVFAILSSLSAQEVLLDLDLPSEEVMVLEVSSEDSFFNVLQSISQKIDCAEAKCCPDEWHLGKDHKVLNIAFLTPETILVSKNKQPKNLPRNYFVPLTDAERGDIGYILRTLANNSLIKIASYKSSLKKAGDRVDHVHPLRFLECIFTNEELKVCARNIQGRSWVWTEFKDGITSSLKTEKKLNNLPPEYIADFANIIKIDVNLIFSAYLAQNWDDFVNTLISTVPRQEGADRYDW